MYTNNKLIRDVADVAARIMSGQQPVTEKLHPNQQKIDVVDDEKIDGKDFAKLHAKLHAKKEIKEKHLDTDKVTKEEVEQTEESTKAKGHDVKAHTKAWLSGQHAPRDDDYGDSKMHELAKRHLSGRNVNVPAKDHDDLAAKMVDRAELGESKQMDEVKMADLPVTRVQGRSYGASKPEPHALDTLRGPKEKELKDIESEKKKKKFSEMVNLYQEKGLKSLSEMLAKEETEVVAYPLDVNNINGVQISTVQEEVEELDEISTKTLAAAAKAASDPDSHYYYGKSHDPQKFADHAKRTKDAKSADAVQGAADGYGHYPRDNTKQGYDKLASRTPTRVTAAGKANKQDIKSLKTKLKEEDMDINAINGVRMSTIGEAEMTDAEKNKREDIVKGMKKGMAGFKERYGKDAKSVMYATATKQSMKD